MARGKDLYAGSTLVHHIYSEGTKVYHIYKDSEEIWRDRNYNKNEIIFNKSASGSYNFEIKDDGLYELTCVAGGGNAWQYWPGEGSYTYASTGGSGSAFVGVLFIPRGVYTINVGDMAQNSSAFGVTAYAGQSATGYSYTSGGAIPSINLPAGLSLISTSLQSAGNGGAIGRGGDGGDPAWIVNRTVSVYQPNIFRNETHTGPYRTYTFVNTNYGYGAGSGCYSQEYTRVNMPPMGGYVKIVYIEDLQN